MLYMACVIITNLQGDVLALVDADGNWITEYAYDAWGNICYLYDNSTTNIATLNPLTYRGYVFDHETYLYYLQSRYYSPEIGRFINADAIIDMNLLLGTNIFSYCINNPVNRQDDSGYLSEKDLDKYITISVSRVSSGRLKITIDFTDEMIRLMKLGWNISTIVQIAALEATGLILSIYSAGGALAITTALSIKIGAIRSIIAELVDYYDRGFGARYEFYLHYGIKAISYTKQIYWAFIKRTVKTTVYVPYMYTSGGMLTWNRW